MSTLVTTINIRCKTLNWTQKILILRKKLGHFDYLVCKPSTLKWIPCAGWNIRNKFNCASGILQGCTVYAATKQNSCICKNNQVVSGFLYFSLIDSAGKCPFDSRNVSTSLQSFLTTLPNLSRFMIHPQWATDHGRSVKDDEEFTNNRALYDLTCMKDRLRL